jgi:crossover junction endodeoxyribonuclease RusA
VSAQIICYATLPIPPGINASYKIARHGRSHRLCATPELELFKQLAILALIDQQYKKIDRGQLGLIDQSKEKIPLALEIDFYYPTLWRHDVDSGVKAVQDILLKHLGLNDNRIVDLHVRKFADRENPRVEARLLFADPET